ncbi:MAG: hypothetical protein A2901_00645 [Elusimicrobia bacterium RIFCSPLOWO2_01_FULL_54_10]|nr:MAG: hypothetical protein A2901_00645 [Elusimicrobia bacterium RIFCSPLOWO2_01_FULL_54_10]
MIELDPSSPATKGDLENVQTLLIKETEKLNRLMAAIVGVLFLGFITLLVTSLSPIIDAWRFRSSTYQDLINQIHAQNTEIQKMNDKFEMAYALFLANQTKQQVETSTSTNR